MRGPYRLCTVIAVASAWGAAARRRRDDYYRGDGCYRDDCGYRGGLVNRIVGDVIGRRLLDCVEGRGELWSHPEIEHTS